MRGGVRSEPIAPTPPPAPFPTPDRRERWLNESPGSQRQSTVPLSTQGGAQALPITQAWKDACRQHFQTMSSRDADEQARLYVERRSTAVRDEYWKNYVTQRDARSAACAANWPHDFALKAAGEAYSTVEVPLPVPEPCRRFFNAFIAVIGGRSIVAPTPDQVRNILGPDGSIRTGPRDAIKMILEDNTTLNVPPNSRTFVDWNAVCQDRQRPEMQRYLEQQSAYMRKKEQVEAYFRARGVRLERSTSSGIGRRS